MEKKHIAIAIDGPVAAGKTTQAKLLAKELGFLYVDTGAMYRTLACYVTQLPKPEPSIDEVLAAVDMKVVRGAGGEQRMFLGDKDVTDQLRTPDISMAASRISAEPKVREFLLEMQRQTARENDVVMEGRDIGTVILPDAQVKVFLTADPCVRAERRHAEMQEKGSTIPYTDVLRDLRERDYNDSHRAVAPLKAAHDAVLLDCTDLTVEETTQELLEIVRTTIGR